MIVIIFIIALILILAIHYYIGRRIFAWLKLMIPSIKGIIFWPIYGSLISCFFIYNLVPTFFLTRTLAIIGSYWLGAFLFLLLSLVIVEFVRLLTLLKIIPRSFVQSVKTKRITGGIVAIFVCTAMIYGSIHARQIQLPTYDVSIDKTVGSLQSLNVVLLSDLHLGHMYGTANVEKWVTEINQLNPDIVVIPGDIFDGNMEIFTDQKQAAEAFRKINSTYGVFASFGNHDAGSGVAEMRQFCEDAGMILLEDEAVLIADSFYVAGMKDSQPIGDQGAPRMPIAEVLADVDQSKPILLLDHKPLYLQEAKEAGVDLVVSGHTHKGQIFPGGLITRNHSSDVDYGYYRNGSLQAIVTSGIGTWGPPVRIGSDSEIVQITLEFQ